MKGSVRNHLLVFGLAPSTRGFGYAVFDGGSLEDWGLKTVKGDKNAQSLVAMEKLVERSEPRRIIIEDYWAEGSRRSERILELGKAILALAQKLGLKVSVVPRRRIHRVLLGKDKGTRQEVATALARRFPAELGHRLPPKRRPWMSEDSRMDIFAAVALAVVGR